MTDFDTIMMDAKRLLKAIKCFAKDHTDNKHLMNRIHAASIMLDRCEADNQLEVACELLRKLFGDLTSGDLDYERERELSNSTQSRRATSLRHSDEAGNGGGDLDHPDVRPPGVPVQVDSPKEPDGSIIGAGGDTTGLAGALPKRKARRSKRKSNIQYRSTIKRIDPEDAA